jgi:hypothetical protein
MDNDDIIVGEAWQLTVENPRHNHDPTLEPAAHAAHRRL